MTTNGHPPDPESRIARYERRCPCPAGRHLVEARYDAAGYRARLADLGGAWSPIAWPDAETAIRDALDTHLEAEGAVKAVERLFGTYELWCGCATAPIAVLGCGDCWLYANIRPAGFANHARCRIAEALTAHRAVCTQANDAETAIRDALDTHLEAADA